MIEGSEETPFDGLLAEDEVEKAHRWALEAVTKTPWNLDYWGYWAFSLLLKGERAKSIEVAKWILEGNYPNEWALAVLFVVSTNGEIENDSRFFGPGGFRLGAIWYLRFDVLRLDNAAFRLWGFIAHYGPKTDQKEILRDVYGVERGGNE